MIRAASTSHAVDVHAALREAILNGSIETATSISQVQLAESLGVSRTPLREALRMLQAEGLVESRPNRQVRVTGLSIMDLDELYSIRIAVESLAALSSVARLTRGDLTRLESCIDEMNRRHTDSLEGWDEPHADFHRVLISRAGNRLAALAHRHRDHARRYRFDFLLATDSRTSSIEQHRRMFEAAQARDARTVAAMLAEHLALTALTLAERMAPSHQPMLTLAALSMTRLTSDER